MQCLDSLYNTVMYFGTYGVSTRKQTKAIPRNVTNGYSSRQNDTVVRLEKSVTGKQLQSVTIAMVTVELSEPLRGDRRAEIIGTMTGVNGQHLVIGTNMANGLKRNVPIVVPK